MPGNLALGNWMPGNSMPGNLMLGKAEWSSPSVSSHCLELQIFLKRSLAIGEESFERQWKARQDLMRGESLENSLLDWLLRRSPNLSFVELSAVMTPTALLASAALLYETPELLSPVAPCCSRYFH